MKKIFNIINFLCHPEFISGSYRLCVSKLIESKTYLLAIIGKMLSHGGQAHKTHTSFVRFVKQVQHDMKFKLTFKKALAFTLAETLIVMGIIGIVSALTLPNLNSSTGEKEKVAKVKKIYQNLDDAFGRAQAVYGPITDWSSGFNATLAGERITEFMKISKNCKNSTGCTATSPKTITGTSYRSLEYDTNSYKFITADGTSIAFIKDSTSIVVDIDGGQNGKNQVGRDIFVFKQESIGSSNMTVVPDRPTNFSDYLTDFTSGDGFYASGWIIDYDNMDYLKLNSSKKCPNGTTPTEQNPRCK